MVSMIYSIISVLIFWENPSRWSTEAMIFALVRTILGIFLSRVVDELRIFTELRVLVAAA
jgi:hypothetical protein